MMKLDGPHQSARIFGEYNAQMLISSALFKYQIYRFDDTQTQQHLLTTIQTE